MSENPTPDPETGDEATQDTTQVETEESVDDLKAKLAKYQDIAKTQEKRAKENAAAAKRLADLEEAQKTDAEKAADRIAKAEAEAATVPNKVADALRGHLIEMHSIDPQDAELFLTATEPELLLKQVARLVESSPRSKRNHVPREGTNHQTTESDERAFVSELFGG